MSVAPGPANGVTDRLLRAVEEFAKTTGEIAELNRHAQATSVETRTVLVEHSMLLARIADALERIEKDQKEGRGVAVQELKQHINERTKAGGWQTMAAWIFAGSATLGAAALAALAALRASGR